MFEAPHGLSQDEIRKRQNDAAFEATEVLFAAIVRRNLLESFGSTQQLDSIAAIMNKDSPDDPKFKQTQNHGRYCMDAINQSLLSLYEGIQHYIDLDANLGDPYEVLYQFLSGHHPKPSCSYNEVDMYGETTYHCDQIAEGHDVSLCRYVDIIVFNLLRSPSNTISLIF